MIKFKRDPKTGELLVIKDGKMTGKIVTMGDEIGNETEKKAANNKRSKEQTRKK